MALVKTPAILRGFCLFVERLFMVVDQLTQADKYMELDPGIAKALNYLRSTDFRQMELGRYEIDGENLIAIVNEYTTIDAATEQMEAHRKYIDVQYIISGAEQMGIACFQDQTISKAYDAEKDYLLVADAPDYFIRVTAGMFTIFFPSDLHMPNLIDKESTTVRKVVMKVAV
jgi:YhcH/YjgK/YiaL family protein